MWSRQALYSLCILALSAPAYAQHMGGSVDAGALNMQYADSVDANAIAVTPSVWLERKATSLNANATLSQFISGGWSAQGAAALSLFTSPIRLFFVEVEGTAGGSTRNDASRTGQALANLRVHVAKPSYGMWLGGGTGATWDGVEWRKVQQGEIAAWTQGRNANALLSTTPVTVDDTISYIDTQISGGLSIERFDMRASAGFRGGKRIPNLGGTAKSWGSASITGWITPRIALVASAGTYPVDLTQGFPGGRFASLSLRVGSRRFSPSNTPVAEAPATNSFALRTIDGRRRELRVRASSARKIEIMGDFTDWTPVVLDSAGNGWWRTQLPIRPGIHEVNMRINGGPWIVPPGLKAKSDEFGSSVGVLVIPM